MQRLLNRFVECRFGALAAVAAEINLHGLLMGRSEEGGLVLWFSHENTFCGRDLLKSVLQFGLWSLEGPGDTTPATLGRLRQGLAVREVSGGGCREGSGNFARRFRCVIDGQEVERLSLMGQRTELRHAIAAGPGQSAAAQGTRDFRRPSCTARMESRRQGDL
jgi:hypothetical protein